MTKAGNNSEKKKEFFNKKKKILKTNCSIENKPGRRG